jgi:hypothetical protein
MHFGSELHAFSLHAGVFFGQTYDYLIHAFDYLIHGVTQKADYLIHGADYLIH